MIKRQLWLRLSLFSLLILLGCRKSQPELIEPPDPSCENGGCCSEGGNFALYKRLKGEPVFYGGDRAIVFRESPIIGNGAPYRGFLICFATMRNLPKISINDISPLDIKEYDYKVFGRMYRYEDATDIAGNPVYMIAVDRLEKVK